MKQGSTFVLIVNLNVDLSRIDSVIFTLKNKDVTLTKENWSYENGKFELPFTQEETVQLQGRTRIEGQINFADGNVAKTQIKDIYIKETLATKIIDGNIATQEGEEVELDVEEDVIYTSENYERLTNKPSINGVVLLGDVSLDALNIASKEYVEEEIAKFDFVKIVTELPEVGLPNRTYFVAKSNAKDNDLYDEYMWINDAWEFRGTKQIEVDLTEYVKKTDFATPQNAGIGKVLSDNGILLDSNKIFSIARATQSDIDSKKSYYKPIVPILLDYAVMSALTNPLNHEWTEEQKQLARTLLNAVGNNDVATTNGDAGLLKISKTFGFIVDEDTGSLQHDTPSDTEINNKRGNMALKVNYIDKAVKSGLAYCLLEWTEEEKAKALELLGVTDLIAGLQAQIDALKG